MRVLRRFCLALLVLLMGGYRPAQAQRIWEVPGDVRAGIDAAVDSAQAGDTILVTQDWTENNKVTVDKAVTVTRDDGKTVTIAAGSSDTYALDITADGALVEKMVLKAGSNPYGVVTVSEGAELRNCDIQDAGHSFTVGAADVFAGARIQSCTFTLTSGQGRAVRICESNSTDRRYRPRI